MAAKSLAQPNAGPAAVCYNRAAFRESIFRAISRNDLHESCPQIVASERSTKKFGTEREDSLNKSTAPKIGCENAECPWASCRLVGACSLKIYARVALTTHNPRRYSRLVELF